MPISINDLAKKLDIAPEAVLLHAMDLDFDVPEDEMLPDDIAANITKLEQGDEIAQTEHELQEEIDREIVEQQQKRTAGNKKVAHKTKKEVKEEPKEEVIEVLKEEDGTVILPDYMTVKEFSVKIGKPIPLVLIKLKKNGVIANLKQEIDYETANIVADEFDVKVRKESSQLTGQQLFRGDLKELLADEEDEVLAPRPAVISIMGHVDHGKTSILDYIRKAKVAEGEAGGITQRIGAYQVEVPHDGKTEKVTFLDTPGHEAFTIMRARGARATDIAVLVVASTEGLKPQSIEAINHAKEAGIPIVVAINKMDMDGANPDLVKGQLAEQELNPADWGGDVHCIPVSAKTGLGIDELLETLLLVAEDLKNKANADRSAICTVIEAAVDPKVGVMATVLVNTGTLKVGDPFVIYDQNGKIRIMKDFAGNTLRAAGPSTPVQILGLSKLPNVGDLLQVMKSDKEARKKAEEVADIVHEDDLSKRKKFSLAAIKAKLKEQNMKQLKVIVKADSKGTLEAVVSEVEKVQADDIMIKVVHMAVGDVQESDVMLSSAGESLIIGFNVGISGTVKKSAEKEGVEILTYDVIYHLTEKLQEIIEGRFVEVEPETVVGQMVLKGVFASNKKMAVAGGEVLEGEVRQAVYFRQFRANSDYKKDDEDSQKDLLLGSGKVISVQLGQKEIGKVEAGKECGLRLEHKELEFAVGDRLEFYVVNK